MSGPKSSSYSLTYEQRRRILEEQQRQREREEEKRRFESESNKKGELLTKLESETEGLIGQVERSKQLKKESGYDMPWIAEAENTLKKARDMSSEARRQKEKQSAELRKTNEQLSTTIKETAKQRSTCADHISRTTEQFRQELDNRISEGFHLSFSAIGVEKRKKDSSRISRINEAVSQLSGMTLSEKQHNKLKIIKEKADAITDPSYLENFYAVVVSPFIRECKEYEAVRDEHDELLIKYAVLASECGISTKPVSYTREGIEFVKDEIAKLEEQALEQKEREYIKKSLDEAMREMGYELVGDRIVSKKSGKRIHHELYSLGNGTAVDVTFSENGQITMELGGVDETDRQPDSDESTQLVEDMKNFCGDYDALAKRLAEKGITTKRLSIMPPTIEHAQIINSNDYKMKKSVPRYSAVRQKKKAAAVLHKET